MLAQDDARSRHRGQYCSWSCQRLRCVLMQKRLLLALLEADYGRSCEVPLMKFGMSARMQKG